MPSEAHRVDLPPLRNWVATDWRRVGLGQAGTDREGRQRRYWRRRRTASVPAMPARKTHSSPAAPKLIAPEEKLSKTSPDAAASAPPATRA